MPQLANWTIPNSGGSTFRAAINTALAAIQSSSSGPAAPSPTVAGMLWYDTTTSILKRRNTANTAWIEVSRDTAAATTVRGNSSGSAAPEAEISMASLRTMLGFSQNTGAPRRITLPGGMILQGGVGNTGASGAFLTFPLAFNTAPTFVASATTTGSGGFLGWNSIAATGVAVAGWSSSTVNANLNYHWLAFGE